MKRATITVPSELEEALDRYVEDQEARPALTSVFQAALSEFLIGRGYLGSSKKLHIRPAEAGSGFHDVSIDHDRHLADR